MSLKIGTYLFTGPFTIESAKTRKNKVASVFAIICRNGEPWDPRFRAVAFGETGNNGLVFKDHPDRSKWEAKNDGELGVYFLPENELKTPGTDSRKSVVKKLSETFPPSNADISIGGGY